MKKHKKEYKPKANLINKCYSKKLPAYNFNLKYSLLKRIFKFFLLCDKEVQKILNLLKL